MPGIHIYSVDNQTFPANLAIFLRCPNINSWLYEAIATLNYVCVTTINVATEGMTWYATDCEPDESASACAYSFYYDTSVSWDKCTQCPDNTVASSTSYTGHKNTTCAYCKKNYYKSGGNCVPCPDGGKTDGYTTAITQCYLDSESSAATDTAGTFTITGGKCYWANT